MKVHHIAAVLSAAALAATAPAQADDTDKARAEVKEEKKELKAERQQANEKLKDNRAELRNERKEAQQDLRSKQQELNKEAKQASKQLNAEVKEEKKELSEALSKLRETRAERRKELRAELRQKYGANLQNAAIREELRTHASRIARLNQIKRIADAEEKDKIEDRAEKLIERENTRHEKQIAKLTAGADQANTQAAIRNNTLTPGSAAEKANTNPGKAGNAPAGNAPAPNTPSAANPGSADKAGKNPGDNR
jgi:chromosome segregation ATPase